MLIANSDSSSSILPRSPLIPDPVETLDESCSSIASIGAHAVHSLALSSPDRDQVSLSTEEVSIPSRNSDGPPSASSDETPIVPSLVSCEHGECNDAQVMGESHCESNNLSTRQGPDEINEPIIDMCLSDNGRQWSPNVTPGYDTDDESVNDWWSQTFSRYKQVPTKIVESPACVGAGLWNLGNSCFVNSVLQCFTHTVPLIESLCSYKSPDPCNCGNERFCVINALRVHMDAALTNPRYKISPFYFFNNLSYFSPDFRRFQQEDAHEFLQAFLDKLEICCLDRRSYSGYISSQDVNIVQRVFGGRLVSGLRCCNCNSLSETYENSLGLSLEIEDVDNLQSALDSFTRVEKLEEPMTCDNCKEKVSKEKQLLLDKLPQVVTFHLKRFKNNGFFMEKIFNHVEFPLELDLQPYMTSSQNNQVATKYNLYAFVEHLGLLACGHYSSYVRSAPNIWHKFDDTQVTRIDEESVLLRDSYILFYAREGTPWFSSTFRQLYPLPDASLQNSSPDSVLDRSSDENTFNKPCDDSAGVPNLVNVKTEGNCLSLSNMSNEDVFQSAESIDEGSPMAELSDLHDPDSNNPCTEKEADSCLTIERATSADDFLSYLMVQNQDSSPKQQKGTTTNQEEEPCKQPLSVSDDADSRKTEIVHRGRMKKLSPRDSVSDQAMSRSGSSPKRPKPA